MEQVLWIVHYLDDVEADFLAIYRIEDPWSLPAPKFFALTWRLVHYQGSVQAMVMAEVEPEGKSQSQGRAPSRYAGEEINHNTAAAKMAAKAAGIPEEEVRVVPLSSFMGMAGDMMEYTQVKL